MTRLEQLDLEHISWIRQTLRNHHELSDSSDVIGCVSDLTVEPDQIQFLSLAQGSQARGDARYYVLVHHPVDSIRKSIFESHVEAQGLTNIKLIEWQDSSIQKVYPLFDVALTTRSEQVEYADSVGVPAISLASATLTDIDTSLRNN